jgi:hypothetical protein
MNYRSSFLITICFSFFLFACSNSQERLSKEENLDDNNDFEVFLNNFKDINPPVNFNLNKLDEDSIFTTGKIEDKYVEKYLCNCVNFCLDTYEPKIVSYLYLRRLPISDNYYSLIYARGDHSIRDNQIRLATFSKITKSMISEIVLCGQLERVYEIASKLNTENIIEVEHLYTFENKEVAISEFQSLPDEKYPGYFVIRKFTAKYQIQNNGKIILLEKGKMQQFIALRNQKGELAYPVQLPKK